MVVDSFVGYNVRLLGFGETNEFNGSDSALMEQLEETMLPVGSRFSKIDDSSRILNDFSLPVHSLSVTLHIELLNVRSKFAQGLAVRNDSS